MFFYAFFCNLLLHLYFRVLVQTYECIVSLSIMSRFYFFRQLYTILIFSLLFLRPLHGARAHHRDVWTWTGVLVENIDVPTEMRISYTACHKKKENCIKWRVLKILKNWERFWKYLIFSLIRIWNCHYTRLSFSKFLIIFMISGVH